MIPMNFTSVLKFDVVMKCSWSFSTLISAISGLFSSISMFTSLLFYCLHSNINNVSSKNSKMFSHEGMEFQRKSSLCFTLLCWHLHTILIEITMDDEDIALPEDTQRILNEFLAEQAKQQEQSNEVSEDWNLSQFWWVKFNAGWWLFWFDTILGTVDVIPGILMTRKSSLGNLWRNCWEKSMVMSFPSHFCRVHHFFKRYRVWMVRRLRILFRIFNSNPSL